MKIYKLSVPEDSLNIIIRALSEGRYKDVYQTMDLLKKQLDEQLKPNSEEGYEVGSSRRVGRKGNRPNGGTAATGP